MGRTAAHGLRPSPGQGWLELFYDLVFVAAILVLSSAYSHDPTWQGAVWLTMVFALMWSAWLTTTLLLNRVALQGTLLRTLLVTQMVLVLMMSIWADDTLVDHTEFVGPTFAAVLVVLALIYEVVRRRNPEVAHIFEGRAVRCLVAAVVFALSPHYPEWWYIVPWVVGLVLVVLPGRSAHHYAKLDPSHLVHRFGEFTIIMMGEAFVKVALIATSERLDETDLFALPLTFVMFFAMWWLYFAEVPGQGLPPARSGRTTWMMAHFPLHLSLTALAVGMGKLLEPEGQGLEARYARYITVPLVVVCLSLAVLDRCVPAEVPRRRALVLLQTAVVLLGVLLGVLRFGRFDLEVTAVALSLVLFWTIWRLRRIEDPTPAGTVPAQ